MKQQKQPYLLLFIAILWYLKKTYDSILPYPPALSSLFLCCSLPGHQLAPAGTRHSQEDGRQNGPGRGVLSTRTSSPSSGGLLRG